MNLFTNRLLLSVILFFLPLFAKPQAFRNFFGNEGNLISNTRGITQDRHGFIWFATSVGLFRYDSKSFKRYVHNSGDKTSIASDDLKEVFCDSKGDLWIGGSAGLDRYNRETDSFTHFDHNVPKTNPEHNNQIYSIFEDQDGRLLIANEFGINAVSVNGEKVTAKSIMYRKFTGGAQSVAVVTQAANGEIWAGSFNGLMQITNDGEKVNLYHINAKEKPPILNEFSSLHISNDSIWNCLTGKIANINGIIQTLKSAN